MRATFKPNNRGIQAAGRSEGVYRYLDRSADRFIDRALALYEPHRKTGEYGRSFHKERTRIRGMAAITVTNTAPHAQILEDGSGPHVIEPKNKQALSWPGAAHPVRRVHHPGTPAYHIMRRALRGIGR